TDASVASLLIASSWKYRWADKGTMKTGLVIAGIAVTLAALWAVRRTGLRSVQPSTFPDDLDGQVLKQLVAAGSNLSKLHGVEFFLYFPDEERASKAFRELTAEGYAGK